MIATLLLVLLLGAVPGHGKLGATCIAGTPEDADEVYARLVAALTGDISRGQDPVKRPRFGGEGG